MTIGECMESRYVIVGNRVEGVGPSERIYAGSLYFEKGTLFPNQSRGESAIYYYLVMA